MAPLPGQITTDQPAASSRPGLDSTNEIGRAVEIDLAQAESPAAAGVVDPPHIAAQVNEDSVIAADLRRPGEQEEDPFPIGLRQRAR